MTKATKFHIGYWIAAFIGVLLVQYVYGTTQQITNIPYSQFEQLLHEGKVTDIGVSDRFIQGKLKQPIEGKSEFMTTRVDPEFTAGTAEIQRPLHGRDREHVFP
jgi:cell division protease FtsH